MSGGFGLSRLAPKASHLLFSKQGIIKQAIVFAALVTILCDIIPAMNGPTRYESHKTGKTTDYEELILFTPSVLFLAMVSFAFGLITLMMLVAMIFSFNAADSLTTMFDLPYHIMGTCLYLTAGILVITKEKKRSNAQIIGGIFGMLAGLLHLTHAVVSCIESQRSAPRGASTSVSSPYII